LPSEEHFRQHFPDCGWANGRFCRKGSDTDFHQKNGAIFSEQRIKFTASIRRNFHFKFGIALALEVGVG
jgi:hypothetical protein